VPHGRAQERELEVDVAGKDVAHPHVNPETRTRNVPETTGSHLIERERFTARQLGIPMPASTAKPFVCAIGLLLMAVGMLFKHLENQAPFYVITIGGAAVLVGALYAWLTTPLEDPLTVHH
jgi:hypothetical protein